MASKRTTTGGKSFNMKVFWITAGVLFVTWCANVKALRPSVPPRFEPRTVLPQFFRPVTTSRRFFNPRATTELAMGFRSILGKVRKRKGGDDDDDDYRDNNGYYEEPDPEPIKPRTPLAEQRPSNSVVVPPVPKEPVKKLPVSPLDVPIRNAPLRMGEDPNSKEINVNMLDKTESVQERINRVKSGKMTQEEKEAFLKAALSTGNSPETRLPLRPPAPPVEIDEKKPRASPFPEDPILRSIAGGKNPAPAMLSNQFVDKSGADSQKKKREYLDMVTDPHRFDVFRSQPRNARLNPSSALTGGRISAMQNYQQTSQEPPLSNNNGYRQGPSSYNPQLPLPPVPSSAPMAAPRPVYGSTSGAIPTTVESNDSDLYPSTDLGTRLEAAAIAQEHQRKQQEQLSREEKVRRRKEEEERRRAAEAKAAEEERRRQEILAQREKEYRERRRKEEEEMARESARQKEEEEKRLKALMEAQELFWQQKLARERELREQRLREEQSRVKQEEPRRSPALGTPAASYPVAPPPPASVPPPVAGPAESSPSQGGDNLSRHVFNPDESSILNGADKNERPSRWEERLPGRKSKPATPIPSFLNDVANSGLPYPSSNGYAKRGKEQQRDEQLERLRELNSPLPSRPAQGRYDSTKRSPATSFQPQRPVSSYSRPPPINGSSYINGSSINGHTSPAPAQNYSPPPPPPPAPAPSRPVNGFSRPPASQQAPPQPASPPERKGPIRMQLPLEDEDDGFDEEEGIDTSSNQRMSIAEALKKSKTDSTMDPEERSKKWGVDMSKFM